jgi:lipoate-protein ligase A
MDGYALNDGARCGVENMALDQHLLETATQQPCVLLRVYRWSQPTLSLGYFQPYVQRLTHSASSQLPVVRRATGGGAIVHHYDWTYCVAMPQSLASSLGGGRSKGVNSIGAAQPLYDHVHAAVVRWLIDHGIEAQLWNQNIDSLYRGNTCQANTSQGNANRTNANPISANPISANPISASDENQNSSSRFLCFERRSCGDVIYGPHKVLGSAQRRSAGGVLQHGSLLLATSPYAPSLAGLSPSLPEHPSPPNSPTHPLEPLLADRRNREQARLELTSQSALCLPNSSPDQRDFFQCLVTAVSEACGVDLQKVGDLAETPCRWNWPTPTRFADDDWTHRL